MSSPEKSPLAPSMTEWSVALYDAGLDELATAIDQDKLLSLKALEDLNLPRVPMIMLPAEEFLSDPDAAADKLKADHYFAILAPLDPTLARLREAGLSKQDIVTFIHKSLPEKLLPKYTLVMSLQFLQRYGGNIVCGDDGMVSVEMLEGEFAHNRLVGGEPAKFTAHRDELTKRFIYSFDDPELRSQLFRTILSIPHTTNEDHADEYSYRGLDFHPGYYEFFLVEREAGARLQPVFIDYSSQPTYTRLSNGEPLAYDDSDKSRDVKIEAAA